MWNIGMPTLTLLIDLLKYHAKEQNKNEGRQIFGFFRERHTQKAHT